jgi:hypothetical protein
MKYNRLSKLVRFVMEKYTKTSLIDRSILLKYLSSLKLEIDILEWFKAYKAVPIQCFALFIVEILNGTNYMVLNDIIQYCGLGIDNNNMIVGREDFVITEDNIAVMLVYGLMSYIQNNDYYRYLLSIKYPFDSLFLIKRYSENHYVIRSYQLGIHIKIYNSANYIRKYKNAQVNKPNVCGKAVNIEININDIFCNQIDTNSIYDHHCQIYNSKVISKAFSKAADSIIKKITCISKEFYHYYIIVNVKMFFIEQSIILNKNIESHNNDAYIMLINRNRLDLIEFLQSYEYIYSLIYITYAYKNNPLERVIDINFIAYMLELDNDETMDLHEYVNEMNAEEINCRNKFVSWIQFIDIVYKYEYRTKPYIMYMMDRLAIVYVDIYQCLNNALIV